MKKQILVLLLAVLSGLTGHSYQFTFDGEAANQYPIVIEVDRNANGSITGRYAYISTLNKQGRENRASWLYIRPKGNSKSEYIISDARGNIQEHWSNATFWKENGVNYFDVVVVNSKGKTFGIFAKSTSKNAGSWVGSYEIHSNGYRYSPPPISVSMTLEANGTTFRGSWVMQITDDDAIDSGLLLADAIGTLNNNIMTIKLTNIGYTRGRDGCYFNSNTEYVPRIENGEPVAKVTKTGTSYKIQPLGKMKKYLTDLGGHLTITKTK